MDTKIRRQHCFIEIFISFYAVGVDHVRFSFFITSDEFYLFLSIGDMYICIRFFSSCLWLVPVE